MYNCLLVFSLRGRVRFEGIHLSSDLQGSFPSILGADGELGGLVQQAAGLLKPRTEGLDLQTHRNGTRRGVNKSFRDWRRSRLRFPTDLLRVAAAVVGDDVRHEGAVLDVLLVAGHVDGVFAGLRRPVTDIARAVVLVLALDLGLRRPLDGEACRWD